MKTPLAAFFAVAMAVPAAAQFPPKELKNVKALPPGTTVPALINEMRGYTRALGVRCTYCHVGREDQELSQYDFAADDKTTKLKAREMIRMVAAINAQYLANLPSRTTPPLSVTCATCHHGIAIPRPIQQVILGVYQENGVDSAIGAYRALRARYYGSAAYDFGEVPLTEVAANAQQQGKPQDALRFHKLNTELLPNSSFAFRQLGFAFLAGNDTASAIGAWTRRLEIDPNNPEAKQLLGGIKKP